MSEWAQEYRKIPFLEKGRDEKGVDCWGLVRLIYKIEKSIELPSYAELYEDTEQADVISRLIEQEKKIHWLEFPKDITPEPFDVIILRMRNRPMHVGIVIDQDDMIHCVDKVGVAVESYRRMKWKDNVLGFARWKPGN